MALHRGALLLAALALLVAGEVPCVPGADEECAAGDEVSALQVKARKKAALGADEELVCYTGTPSEKPEVAAMPFPVPDFEVCLRYQYQCTAGDTMCTEQEGSEGAWKWAYGAGTQALCDVLKGYGRNVCCCTEPKCNGPDKELDSVTAIAPEVSALQAKTNNKAAVGAGDALVCYTGAPSEKPEVVAMPFPSPDFEVCMRYQYPCTAGDTTCTKQESSEGTWKWSYAAGTHALCDELKDFAKDLYCCAEPQCNAPDKELDPETAIAPEIALPAAVSALQVKTKDPQVCYSSVSMEKPEVMAIPFTGEVCMRYQLHCTENNALCTPEERGEEAWKWVYGTGTLALCDFLKNQARNITCCAEPKCNAPDNELDPLSVILPDMVSALQAKTNNKELATAASRQGCPAGYEVCAGMGQVCGDRSCCTGMGAKCGANSVCTGMDSKCGAGSTCTGFGATCAGQSESSAEGGFPMPGLPMPDFPEAAFPPFKQEHTAEEHAAEAHAAEPDAADTTCDSGAACAGRSVGIKTNGIDYCCKASCSGHCVSSMMLSGGKMSQTCTCIGGASELLAIPGGAAPPRKQASGP